MAKNNVVALPNVKTKGTPKKLKDDERIGTPEEDEALERYASIRAELEELNAEKATISEWMLAQFEAGVRVIVAPPYKCTRVEKKPSERFNLKLFLERHPEMYAQVQACMETGETPAPYILVT